MDEESIFAEALARPAGPDRAAYVEETCGRDAALRRRIDALLEAHERASHFLDPSACEILGGARAGGVEPPDDASSTVPGEATRIGPYRLITPLGEGGMGVVYMAEQEKPVRRMVALKLIRPGMDSDQVVARFEAERQVLALMDHPNIARVLDAGASESGQLYFVMELIDGTPIARYCDDQKLSIRERLSLFVRVCMAIQHAHQKGIIHRDIKSSNVLVSVHDGAAIPKVIDFGVSKAVGPFAGPPASFAQSGIVGTLESMSPEQAELGSLDVDTRSDVYSLGVLLYLLLTGCTPLDSRTAEDTSYSEMLRRIREVTPPRPSVRLSGSFSTLSTIASLRNVGPARLPRILRGDLDWIVMKALEKDRTRRYDSASGLAQDIERFLRDEPVEACPGSTSYRLRKFVRRHRVGLATAAAFVAILALSAVVGILQALRATGAEQDALVALRNAQAQAMRASRAERKAVAALDEARSQAEIKMSVIDFLQNDLLYAASPVVGPGQEATLRTVLDRASLRVAGRFRDRPLVEAAIRHILGHTYWSLGQYEQARIHLEGTSELRRKNLGPHHPDSLTAANDLAVVYLDQGKYDQAEPILTRLLEDRERILGRDHLDTLTTALNLAQLEHGRGQLDRARRRLRELIATASRLPADLLRDHVLHGALSAMAALDGDRGQFALAEPLLVEALHNARRTHGPQHPTTLSAMNDLGLLYREQAKLAKAESLLRNALEARRRRLGARHPDTLASMNNLALLEFDLGRFDKAERLLAEALEGYQASEGARGRETLSTQGNLAMVWRALGHFDRAESLQEQVTAAYRAKFGDEHPDTLVARNNLASVYRDLEHLDQAASLQDEVVATSRRVLGDAHTITLSVTGNFAETELRRGRAERALAILAELGAAQKKSLGTSHPDLALTLSRQGRVLLEMGKPDEAERPLREALAILEQALPDDWQVFSAKSLIGASLARRARRAEAEPLLLAGYEGMKAREGTIPAPDKRRLAEAGRAIVRLYDEWGKPERAAEWRARLGPAQSR